jgi:aryl-alcohol dehydrogenase-like predicted oxidoreductase
MEMRTLGKSDIKVSAVGLGLMSMSGIYGNASDEESIRVIHYALEKGINFLDSADMYGWGHNEELLGRALKGKREGVIVATKFGQVKLADGKQDVDGSPAYVQKACEASLKRLGIEVIDLYYQHRVDSKVPIEETVGAMKEFVDEGKVRFLGLSEAQPEDLRRASAVAPIATLQSEYSLFERYVENEVLDACEEHGIGFLAYAPLGRGMLTGRFRSESDFSAGDFRGGGRYPRFTGDAFRHNLQIVAEVESVARERDATAAQVALAWLLTRRPWVVPIPGTKRVQYVEQNAAAVDLELTADELERLDALLPAGGSAAGDRYADGRVPTWVSPRASKG